jgi:hypothetical protein
VRLHRDTFLFTVVVFILFLVKAFGRLGHIWFTSGSHLGTSRASGLVPRAHDIWARLGTSGHVWARLGTSGRLERLVRLVRLVVWCVTMTTSHGKVTQQSVYNMPFRSIMVSVLGILEVTHNICVLLQGLVALRRRRKCIINACCVIVGHHDHFT